MKYLLDTNVISELASRQPDANLVAWVQSVDEMLLYLSVITIGEIKKGGEKLPDSVRKDALAAWLAHELLQRFENRLLVVDLNVMLTWGELTAQLEHRGRVLPAIDSLIAALALNEDCVLVTRNTSDFDDTGVETLNPWLWAG